MGKLLTAGEVYDKANSSYFNYTYSTTYIPPNAYRMFTDPTDPDIPSGTITGIQLYNNVNNEFSGRLITGNEILKNQAMPVINGYNKPKMLNMTTENAYIMMDDIKPRYSYTVRMSAFFSSGNSSASTSFSSGASETISSLEVGRLYDPPYSTWQACSFYDMTVSGTTDYFSTQSPQNAYIHIDHNSSSSREKIIITPWIGDLVNVYAGAPGAVYVSMDYFKKKDLYNNSTEVKGSYTLLGGSSYYISMSTWPPAGSWTTRGTNYYKVEFPGYGPSGESNGSGPCWMAPETVYFVVNWTVGRHG